MTITVDDAEAKKFVEKFSDFRECDIENYLLDDVKNYIDRHYIELKSYLYNYFYIYSYCEPANASEYIKDLFDEKYRKEAKRVSRELQLYTDERLRIINSSFDLIK